MSEEAGCTPPGGDIDASSDIVGPGVISAFFATASITIIAVIIAYLSDSLEGKLVNELDRMVISWAMEVSRNVWAHIRRETNTTTTQPSNESGSSLAWKKTIQEFILALSDQQLVTGLAILIAGISNQDNLLGYEFSVMTCLAWFSSTTHLATMDALRAYLRDRGAVRSIRAVGIVAVVLLLLYAFVVTTNVAVNDELRRIPVRCLLTDKSYDNYGGKTLPLVAWILVSFLIVWGYVIRLVDLYSERGLRTLVSNLLNHISQKQTSQSPTIQETNTSASPISPATEESRVGVQQNSQRHAASPPTFLQIILRGADAYNAWFLSSLSTINFSFSYGISQLSLYRWQRAPKLTKDTNNMGFGQLMPLFLLALPFLTAIENYYGYKEKRSSEAQPSTGVPEPGDQPEPSTSLSQDGEPLRPTQDNTTQTSDENSGHPERRSFLDNDQDTVRNSSSQPQKTHNPSGREGLNDSATVEFHKNELKFGLFLFFLSLIRSISLGVLLNGAAMFNDNILRAAIGIFIVSFSYQVTKVLPSSAKDALLLLESNIMDIVRGKGKKVKTGSNGVELRRLSGTGANRNGSRASRESSLD